MTIPNHDSLLDDPLLHREPQFWPQPKRTESEPDPCSFCQGNHDERDCPMADESIDEDLYE